MPHTVGPAPELFTLDRVGLVRDGVAILDGVSDHIHEGHATALVGPSGSGKTTLLRMLNRLEEPTSGRILYRGRDIRDYDVRDLRRRVGLLGQRPVMLTPTVGDELRVARAQLTDDEVTSLLARVALVETRQSRSTAGMSGGEQQRLALARALTVEPEVLLLDEPTSALDPVAAASVDQVIRDLVSGGLSVVLVSHDLDRAAAVSDEVLVLDHGRLVERGRPEDVRYLSS